MAENSLLASIGSLVHELRGSASFILGIYEALDQKIPESAQGLWTNLGRVSERILIEIEDQLGNLLANVESFSPVTAAARIGDLASGWEDDCVQLLVIVDEISRLQIQLENSEFNTILSEYLPSSVRGFSRIVSFARQIQPEDL